MTKNHVVERANHLVMALVVSRMLLLWTFQQQKGTPLSWLMYQLTADFHSTNGHLYNFLAKRTDDVLEVMRCHLMEDTGPSFFALDEAQFGYKLLKDDGLWNSLTHPEEKRGIACQIIRTMTQCLRPIVVAGTALSLVSIQSAKSNLRSNGIEIFESFPSLSLDEVIKNLQIVLNLESVEFTNTDVHKLEGRGRLFGEFCQTLAQLVKKSEDESKQEQFQTAVLKHYQSLLARLEGRIKEGFGLGRKEGGKDDQTDVLAKEQKKRKLPDSLRLLATATLIGGYTVISRKKIKVDLLNIGLCSVRAVPYPGEDAENTEFILDEELGRNAVLNIAQDRNFMTESFQTAASLCRINASNSLEPLIVAELHNWSVLNPNRTVKDFLTSFCDIDGLSGLPKWIDTAPFHVDGGQTRSGYFKTGIFDDVGYIRSSLQNEKIQNILLSPSTVKRPDYESIMRDSHNTPSEDEMDYLKELEGEAVNASEDGRKRGPWFLSVSSKCYSKVFNDEKEKDLRSTRPDKFYLKANGNENGKCASLRKAWLETLDEHKDVFSKCLRIHVCLPEVVRKNKDPSRLFLDNDGSIVVYITSQNIRKVFRDQSVKALVDLGYIFGES